MNFEKCIGCGACEDVCPTKCITMSLNSEGFITANKALDSCIDCNMCEKVCPLNVENKPINTMLKSFMWINRDEYDRNLSSSGGFFKAISDLIIDRGGVVFGAALTSDFNLEHTQANTKEEVYPLMGSKYLQSNTKNTYSRAKQYLMQDKWVLYSGTPCQIAGLKTYLGKEYDKLVTVDVFCHGVPSVGVWQKYLEEYHGDNFIRYVQFRAKNIGWWEFQFRVQYAKGEYNTLFRKGEDDYVRAFLKGITLNENCYDCRFRSKERFSDFFIGDAWNINKIRTNMDDNRGITTVIANSKKALALLDEIKASNHCFEVDINDGAYKRSELFESNTCPKERKQFFEDFQTGFRYAVEKNKI